MRSQAITFFIDCPQSRPKVVVSALKQIATTLVKMEHSRFCIYIPCGGRFDLLHIVRNNCRLNFGSRADAFVVTHHSGGNQTRRSTSTYAVLLTSTEHPLKNIPAHTAINKCRARSWEATKLRCMDANCPHLLDAKASYICVVL